MLRISYRKRGQTVAEILLAYAFIGLLLGIRAVLDRYEYPPYVMEEFTPLSMMMLNETTDSATHYYPVNPCTTTIVNRTVEKLVWSTFQYPKRIVPASSSSLSSLSEIERRSIHAFIHFTNLESCTNASTMPDQIRYTLRMPESGLYYYNAHIVKPLEASVRLKRSPEDFCQDLRVLLNYAFYFVGLQYSIDLSIIGFATNKIIPLDKELITLRHIGCPKAYGDQLHVVFGFFVAVFFSITYSITYIITLGHIVEERENKTKEYLRIFGMKTWLNNLVWFIRSMFIYIILTSAITGCSLIVLPDSFPKESTIAKAVFNNTNWTLIWTILFVYSIQLSSFTVFFAQFFKRPLLAKMIGFLVCLFTLIDFYDSTPIGVLYFLCLFPNVGLLLCIQVILQYERRGVDTTTFNQLYTNLFSTPLYIGVCLAFMLFYSIVFMLLAIYVERINPGEFGIPQRWYYPLMPSYWRPKQKSRRSNSHICVSNENKNNWIEDKTAQDSSTILSIDHLTKKFGKITAVRNLSLEFNQGKIYSLLGHNGAGKTTTTFILVGMLKPTAGTITLDGFDGLTQMQEMRRSIGFCPQYGQLVRIYQNCLNNRIFIDLDILFEELTVREHLELISDVRHIDRSLKASSIKEILELIGLAGDQHTLAKNLSGGMKRRLSLGIALIGDAKVLILDEPTSGIDPYNRRLVWSIIRKMKERGKCIILTTHFLEEADVLSDRIAVISKGRLQANGTPDFLKQQTEYEYRLFIGRNEQCDIELVTKFIQEYDSTIVLERHSASELVYGIKRGSSNQICSLINGLEDEGHALGVTGYGISATTIEEVFLKLVQEEAEETEEKLKHNVTNNVMNDDKKKSQQIVFLNKHNRHTGFSLLSSRFIALLKKRMILSKRQYFIFLSFFLMPVLMAIIIIATVPTPKQMQARLLLIERIADAQVTFAASHYSPQTVVFFARSTDSRPEYYLTSYLKEMGANLIQLTRDDVANYISSRYLQSYTTFMNEYQFGFSLNTVGPDVYMDVYFSTFNFHTMPTAINTAMNVMFQYQTNSTSKRIITTNQPILIDSVDAPRRAVFYDRISCFDILPISLLNFLTSIIGGLFISLLILNVIRERISHSKELQLLTRTSKRTYWITHALYDFILCIVVCVLLTIVMRVGAIASTDVAAEVRLYEGSEQTGYFFLLFLFYCIASIPFTYMFSFVPNSELIGFIMFLIIITIGCFLDMVLGFVSAFTQSQPNLQPNQISRTTEIMNILRWILSVLVPTINFKRALFNLRTRSNPFCITALNTIMRTEFSMNEGWVAMKEPGLGIQILVFVGQFVVSTLVILLIESKDKIARSIERSRKKVVRRFRKIRQRKQSVDISNSSSESDWSSAALDVDVKNERQLIINGDRALQSSVLVLQDLVRRFKKKRRSRSFFSRVVTVVDHLNFYVPQRSCFGLLGANGAGKTTTFRMLIQAIPPTSGRVLINGQDFHQLKNSVDIGFCPQFDWLLDNLTVTETLTLFAELKGLYNNEIPNICNDIIQIFDLEPHRRKEVKHLSGGTKRKLSTALAFLANPALVFLDEPTTGLDAAAKRKLWNVIRTARDAGLTIILTSHSMEECEALCTKIGIMKSGQFACLGSLQHLKNRFGRGYAIQIKTKPEHTNRIANEIKQTIPTIEIEDQQNGVIFCNLPFSSNGLNDSGENRFASKLSSVFEFLDHKKSERSIEHYAVSQTTLEQIFLRIAGHDKDENEDDTTIEVTITNSEEELRAQPISSGTSEEEIVVHFDELPWDETVTTRF